MPMSEALHKRSRLFANKLHKDMFCLIFFAMIVPTLVTAVGLFYLIFNITADQMGFPEAIAQNVIPAANRVVRILAVVTPVVIAGVLFVAYKLTHQIVGPFDRIVREINESVEGKKTSPISLRKNDKFWPLVQSVNKLLDKV